MTAPLTPAEVERLDYLHSQMLRLPGEFTLDDCRLIGKAINVVHRALTAAPIDGPAIATHLCHCTAAATDKIGAANCQCEIVPWGTTMRGVSLRVRLKELVDAWDDRVNVGRWHHALDVARLALSAAPTVDGVTPKCGLCGEPMLAEESMFRFHGYSGPCPKPAGLGKDGMRRVAEMERRGHPNPRITLSTIAAPTVAPEDGPEVDAITVRAMSLMTNAASRIESLQRDLDAARRENERLHHPPPIPMVLHCPACGLQHVDEAEHHDITVQGIAVDHMTTWDNPPHRSHLCHGCGHIWRPCDLPTNGVAAIATKGKHDSPAPAPKSLEIPREIAALRELVAVKDLKERATKMNCMARGAPGKIRADLLVEYRRRQPLAWAAARSALAMYDQERG